MMRIINSIVIVIDQLLFCQGIQYERDNLKVFGDD